MRDGEVDIKTVSFTTNNKKGKKIRVYISWGTITGSNRPLKQLHTSLNPDGYLIFQRNIKNDLRPQQTKYRHSHESEHKPLRSFLGKYVR